MIDWQTYNKLTHAGLSPDEYYYLAILLTKTQKKTNIIIPRVKRSLILKGILTKDLEATEEFKNMEIYEDFQKPTLDDFFASIEESVKYKEYLDLFPNVFLTPTRPLKRSLKEVTDKFKAFYREFKDHNYSWDDIISATKTYIEKTDFEGKEAKYLKDSSSFILDSKGESLLLSYCQKDPETSFKQDI
jgi:hypothetical protein